MLGLAMILGLLTAMPAEAQQRAIVVDGDTIRVGGRLVRMVGIDAPELRTPRCPHEAELARAARDRLDQLVAGGVTLRPARGRDRYGRLLAEVYDRRGRELGQVLIAEGFARPYDGHGRRAGWCGGP